MIILIILLFIVVIVICKKCFGKLKNKSIDKTTNIHQNDLINGSFVDSTITYIKDNNIAQKITPDVSSFVLNKASSVIKIC
jgi:hypothetical protein